ncbi:MAG: SH3 domain-containing protein, partial [Archangium sp.]|nr:SH3 domain-containing protein [Archangium sp.]
MTQRLIRLAVACCLVASPALAVSKGGKLYIKSKDTKVLDK